MTSIVTRLIGVGLALCLWSMTAGSTSAARPAAVAGSSASTDAAIVAGHPECVGGNGSPVLRHGRRCRR